MTPTLPYPEDTLKPTRTIVRRALLTPPTTKRSPRHFVPCPGLRRTPTAQSYSPLSTARSFFPHFSTVSVDKRIDHGASTGETTVQVTQHIELCVSGFRLSNSWKCPLTVASDPGRASCGFSEEPQGTTPPITSPIKMIFGSHPNSNARTRCSLPVFIQRWSTAGRS